MLAAAWAKARSADDDCYSILRILDVYLCEKQRFLHYVRQETFSNVPGLRRFDRRYFSALKRKTPPRENSIQAMQRPERATPLVSNTAQHGCAFAISPRIAMSPYGDVCRYLLESPDLRRIELRIAPFDTATEYLHFFHSWKSLLKQIKSECGRDPEIRFAVHFKRTREARNDGKPDSIKKLRELDRHTAALRIALSSENVAHRECMKALARVDVAGQERDTPAALFASHLRLLRGDPAMLEYLEHNPDDDRFARWHKLKSRGLHRPAINRPALGMTVHAGEDFADILDGLYQIGAAVELFDLKPGDGIGHGLALTSTLEAFGQSRKYAMMPLGTAHDSLCWLFDFVNRERSRDVFLRHRSVLESLIARSASRIHQSAPEYVRDAGIDDRVWIWRQRAVPTTIRESEQSYLRRRLLALEAESPALLQRERMEPLDRDRKDLDSLVLWAQSELLDEIKRRRIVIEMNPASNLRISGANTLAASPTIKLLQATDDGLLACINTDDPGIFTSCIENEYALLLAGMRRSELGEGAVRALLDRVRQIGMEFVYWPNWPRSNANVVK